MLQLAKHLLVQAMYSLQLLPGGGDLSRKGGMGRMSRGEVRSSPEGTLLIVQCGILIQKVQLHR